MSIKPCVASRAKRLRYPNRLSFCSRMQIPKFPTRIKACFYVALQRTAWCCGRLTEQTKSIQIFAQWRWRVRHRHTGCTQALWRELGVPQRWLRSRICVMAMQSRFQVAPRVLRKRPDKPGYELASAGNWRLCPRHASFGSPMKAKKKKKKKKKRLAAMILIVTPPLARGG